MPQGDLYRVAFEYSVWGQVCVNVLYMAQRAGGPQDAQEVAEALAPAISAVYDPLHGLEVLHRSVKTALVSRVLQDTGEAILAEQGSGGSGALSPTLALVCTIRTGLAGRTRRGRIYIGGAATLEEGGIITGSGVPKANAFVTALTNAFLTEQAASGFQLGVFSRERFKLLSNPFDQYWAGATSVGISSILGNQRRRRPGVGN